MGRRNRYTLITGGAGFIGSNMANALASDGQRVVLLDNLSRPGVARNARWLMQTHGSRVRLEHGDVADPAVVRELVSGAERVYHFAAQVAVTTSVEDPTHDLQANLVGTFNVLEAARQCATPPPVLFTSTNKVYGGLDHLDIELRDERYRFVDLPSGVSEREPLDFHSPYGCSKGAADQYVRDYARVFDVPTVVFRMSCIYGRRQWGTEDQGWVAHFGRALIRGEPITIYGDGQQVRDILWIDDLIAGMRRAMERIRDVSGEIFNIGGGPANAVSVGEVVERLAGELDVTPEVGHAEWRPGDQRVYVTDHRKASRLLGWRPTTEVREGLSSLLDWLSRAESDDALAVSGAPDGARRAVAGASA